MKNFDNNYEMQSLFESEKKYDISEIARIAFTNMDKWINVQDFKYFKNELDKSKEENKNFGDLIDLFYKFFDMYINKFLDLLSKHNNIEKDFLMDHRDEIIYGIIELYVPPVKDRNEVGQSKFGGEDPEEDKVVAQALRKSREIMQKPKVREYSQMSRWELEKIANNALDNNDFETLRKIQPFIKESLRIKINSILNEEYLMPRLRTK